MSGVCSPVSGVSGIQHVPRVNSATWYIRQVLVMLRDSGWGGIDGGCVRLPLTLGGLGGIILHGEKVGGSWIVLSCAYQQTKA